MMRFAALLVTPALAACASTVAQAPDGAPIPVERAAITYSTQPCFGTCPVYAVTVSPDGQGVFEGRNHTAVNGEKRFVVDAATYRRFADHLAGLKPESGDRRIDMQSPDCGVAPTDMPSIEVRWSTGTGGPDQTLSLYLGCRGEEAQRVATVLKTAPDLLPIAAYIGKR
jgi:hypothetical protein